MLNKIYTMTAKSAPYPPCTVIRQLAELKYQDPARCCRRVTQPPFIAGPLAAILPTILTLKFLTKRYKSVTKKADNFVTIVTIFVPLVKIGSNLQDS